MAPLMGLAFSKAALDGLAGVEPAKVRAQVLKKAKALLLNPHPQGSKKLNGVAASDGSMVYRERSGDYRILYVVRVNPAEVVILDIDDRKDIYK